MFFRRFRDGTVASGVFQISPRSSTRAFFFVRAKGRGNFRPNFSCNIQQQLHNEMELATLRAILLLNFWNVARVPSRKTESRFIPNVTDLALLIIHDYSCIFHERPSTLTKNLGYLVRRAATV